MSRKLLSLALVLVMVFALAIPAFAVEGDPVITASYNKKDKAVTVTVDNVSETFTGINNNTEKTFTVSGWEVTVVAKNDDATIKSTKEVAAPVSAPAITLASSNSQIVTGADTRIWQDGFGFHCNNENSNGQTSVIFEGKTYKKGDQKDVFGTKANPIGLTRVGTSTAWTLESRSPIVCATCGRTDWVTYSNNSGVINGKNIQANHPIITPTVGTIVIVKVWLYVDGDVITNEERIAELTASFTIGEDEAVIGENEVEAGTYIVSEIDGITSGFSLVSDNNVEVTVEAGKTSTVTFINQEQGGDVHGGEIIIEKTVDGAKFNMWLEGKDFSDEELVALLADISFNLYAVDAKDADFTGAEPVGEGTLDADIVYGGYSIRFAKSDGTQNFIPGWYAVEEVLGTIASKIFGDVDPMYIYVTADGYTSYGTQIISGEKYGAIVTGEKFPDIWESQLDSAEFAPLKDMNAEWIWGFTDTGVVDTHQYGTNGSEAKFEIEVYSPTQQTVKMYFVCDNAAVIYVNDDYATFTATAFEGSVMSFPQKLSNMTAQYFFNTLGADEFNHPVGAWSIVYAEDITLEAGTNTITIFAANTRSIEGTVTEQYNNDNNPCGLIFVLEVPGEAFDNTEISKQYGNAIMPMVSVGSEENGYVDAAGDWGQALWSNALPYDVFVASGELDEDGEFSYGGMFDVQGEFIWDKNKEAVTNDENPEGGDLAYFKFEYGFEAGADLNTLKFTDFKIAADNEFCLLVNGKIVQISKNFANLTGMTSDGIPDLFFKEDYLASLYDKFMALNNPLNNIGEVYSWSELYTIKAKDMLAAFQASGKDSVVIEIYAYNVPEKAEILAENSSGVAINPAMVIFCGSFAYETVTITTK